MLSRQQSKIKIGDNLFRYIVKLNGNRCLIGTHEARIRQIEFLRSLLEHPDLLNCGPVPFEQLNICHNGECWSAEAQSEVEEE